MIIRPAAISTVAKIIINIGERPFQILNRGSNTTIMTCSMRDPFCAINGARTVIRESKESSFGCTTEWGDEEEFWD
jgi:hypothetical protein